MTLKQIEDHFNSIELPDSVQLNSCTFVSDVRFLVDSNLRYLKVHPRNKSFLPYYNQLIELKKALEK